MHSIRELKNRISKLDVILLGNGPTLWDYDQVKLYQSMIPTIGINASWRFIRADYHCCLDEEHVDDYIKWYYTPTCGYIVTADKYKDRLGQHKARAALAELMPKIPLNWEQSWCTDLALGGFPQVTGLFAIQLAIYMGAKRLWLLGFDSSADKSYQHRYYNHAAKVITLDRPEVEIYNCNSDSLIKAFEKKERKEWLREK